MKKLILFLLLLAALAVAWLYWQPAEPTNAPAAVSNAVRPAPQVQPQAEADENEELDSEDAAEEADVVIDITGVNFAFSTETIEVNQGDTVTINFESTEGFHDWVVDEFNAATEQVNPGTPTSVTFVADQDGEFEYYCSVGQHRENGMVGTLIVTATGDAESEEEETQEEESAEEGEVFVPEQPLAEVDEVVADSSAGEGTTYSLASNSRVEWRGTKVAGAHNGYVPVTEGAIQVNNGTITAGNFTLDMSGINATDIDSDDLDGHLKERFNTEEYPNATFDIVAVSATSVQGNLTMNGITRTITFPATVIVEDDVVIANAEFSLDKSLWEIGGMPGVSEFMDISLSLTWTQ